MNMLKINIGSNRKKVKGYKNLDILDDLDLDYKWDITKTPYPFFKDGEVDEILAEEVLEHISFRQVPDVLREWHRILKNGGIINIQVPDCGKAMFYYVNNMVCPCIPHKIKGEIPKADPECNQCLGKGMIHPDRWLFSFTGAQKHKYDVHKTIFDKKMLENVLKASGFKYMEFKDDQWKLKVKIIK